MDIGQKISSDPGLPFLAEEKEKADLDAMGRRDRLSQKSMNGSHDITREAFNSDEERELREVARGVGKFYDDVAGTLGFKPSECRAAWAISIRFWEDKRQDYDTPREISLAEIGKSLPHKSE